MSDVTWTNPNEESLFEEKTAIWPFVIGGIVALGLVVFLVMNAANGNAQLYKTVGEFYAQQGDLAGRDLRIAGWVIGDSIEYTQLSATESVLTFEIVDDLSNPTERLQVVAYNEPKPDLLQHEAQALVEGQAKDGQFVAHEGGLMLKCPTRYEEAEPEA